jgi:hypothetical protein
MPDANVDLGQTVKGSFTPKELLASSGSQNLAPNYSYYLPTFHVGALNLAMPTSAAIGTTFDISSIYSNGIDGTIGANLTALNLTLPAGEYITGWGGAGVGATINLLVSYTTGSGSYVTPNFTQGCTFRLTKTGATSWAIKPTFGSVLPKRFLVKNEGGAGGTVVSTAVPAGTYRHLTLPDADVDLGDLPSVATTDSNVLSGTRTRILGGSSNTVSGTDNVAIECTGLTLNGDVACSNIVAVGVHNSGNYSGLWPFPKSTVVLGSSTAPTVLLTDSMFGAALGGVTCLYTGMLDVSATVYNVTADGNNTAANTNCLKAVAGTTAHGAATHELEFIIAVGTNGGVGSVAPRRHIYAKRKVHVNRDQSGTMTSSTITPETEVTLGDAATGSVTIGITVDTTNNRIVPTITGTSGTNQTHYQASVRVKSHYNSK